MFLYILNFQKGYNMDISYIINQLGEERENYFNAVSPPIIQTSNFVFNNVEDMRYGLSNEHKVSCYTRGLNPTVEILRKKVAALEATEDSLVLSSGCAAISSAVLSVIKSGDHIVCIKNPYSWTNKLMNVFLPRFGVTCTMVDGRDPENFRKAIKENTVLFYIETPNSLVFDLQDIEAITKIARENNIITIADNSYCTPLNQQPALMGVDIIVHSATKYFAGHSDVVAGFICSDKERIEKIFHNEFMNLGGIISPNDAWLIIRGMRTMQIRMEQSYKSTTEIINYLKNNPKVDKIFYPFDPDFPQYELAKKQMKRASSLFTFSLKSENREKIENFCNSLKRFLMAVSWGGYESLILPSVVFGKPGEKSEIPINLIRLYIGLEESNVLIEDLKQAFEQL